MNNLIDRQAAVNAILNDKVEITPVMKAIGIDYGSNVHNEACECHAKMLRELPPAEPQYYIEDSTRTLWIKIEHGALEKVNRIFVEDGEWCKPFYVGRI